MKKLLHERLREVKTHDDYCKAVEVGNLAPVDAVCASMAKEIERYYIPRPRDNMGIPYIEGDTVWSTDPETEYNATVSEVRMDEVIIRWEDGIISRCKPFDLQHDLPSPKVLDADGVEKTPKVDQMNIDEIRAEISKAFQSPVSLAHWVEDRGAYAMRKFGRDGDTAARILVDWAYEAGVSDGGRILGESEHREYKSGFDDAAKDPSAWYVLDKNGEPVHIGDIVKDKNGEYEIKALGIDIIFEHYWHKAKLISKCEKVIPDTRDKIKEELTEAIWEGWDDYDIGNVDNPGELAEQFISRIEALGRDS